MLATTTSGSAGDYQFCGLASGGQYRVELPLASSTWQFSPAKQGSDATRDADFVAAGTVGRTALLTLGAANDFTWDAGLNQIPTPTPSPTVMPALAAIGDRVWYDLDADGLQDSGEVGAPGVTVRLLDAGGSVLAAITTDASGNYGFAGLAPGGYRIAAARPSGETFAARDQGGDDATDSDVDPATGRTALVTLPAAATDLPGRRGPCRRATLATCPDGPYPTFCQARLARCTGSWPATSSARANSESDGEPDSAATGDDSAATGGDDEDGVVRLAAPNSPAGGWTDGQAADGDGCRLEITVSRRARRGAGLAGLRQRADAVVLRARPGPDPGWHVRHRDPCRDLRRAGRDLQRRDEPEHLRPLPAELSRRLERHRAAPDGEVEDYLFAFGPAR